MVCHLATIVAQQTTPVVEIARQNVHKCQFRLKLQAEIQKQADRKSKPEKNLKIKNTL